MATKSKKLHILLLSIHGLIRAKHLPLGCDADTGGQTKYVVELAKALAKNDDVGRVDLITRRLVEDDLDDDYAQEIEVISEKAQIIRIDCAEEKYLPKEQLWDYLDNFADNIINYLRDNDIIPDVIHSHYADAGYVASRLSHLLALPLVHTGHSLGRDKRRQLLLSGVKEEDIERKYNITRRIHAEEETLAAANIVITSTTQEIEKQYLVYDYYQPQQMRVIPPGTNLHQFYPPKGDEHKTNIYKSLCCFLRHPEKPMILALSRPDQRKNIRSLVEAYGQSAKLQKMANLVIIAGNRDDISDMEEGAQEVLTDLLILIDSFDLYGKVAYPKHHQSKEVATIYRIASLSKGVFVNPALTEPFGLTLIEAAACGLPIVATEDGGPIEIIKNCQNGFLIDPLDTELMAKKLFKILNHPETWEELSANGISGVKKNYSWKAHVKNYLNKISPIIGQTEPVIKKPLPNNSMLFHDRAIFTDLDQSLLGDEPALRSFLQLIKNNRKFVSFGVATGRRLDSALTLLRQQKIPQPEVLMTSLGTEIYYAPDLTRDKLWTEHIDYLWKPKRIKRLLSELPGLVLQNKSEQSTFKISYYFDLENAPSLEEINRLMHQNELNANLFLSFGQFLDIIPLRASKGLALRWFAERSHTPLEKVLAAGGSGADEDMVRGNTLGVIVSNRHDEELSDLSGVNGVYFAQQPYANGLLEAIDHYDFFEQCEEPTK